MALPNQPDPGSSADATFRLARLLRHEVGDLLQSVYSTIGILLERLPEALSLERRLISDLKSRSELCKFELDAIVEAATEANLTPGQVDLMTSVHASLAQIRRRCPGLQVHFDTGGSTLVAADARALASCISVLFLSVSQAAQRQMWVRVHGNDKDVVLCLERDGYAASPELFGWLQQPFVTTQNALFGLGLALAKRLVTATGGEVTAANRPEGGLGVTLRLPAVEA